MLVSAAESAVLVRELDRRYPVIDRAEGVWLHGPDGDDYLDAVGGGAMVTSIGFGVGEVIAAAGEQIRALPYVYNQQFTTPPQESLARELLSVAPPEFARVHFVSGGTEANEMAIRLARSYHVERGDERRWQIISPAQAYHGPSMTMLALTGRPSLQFPYQPYLSEHLHIPPSTWRFDATGQLALDALDAAIEAAGADTIAAFFCEPISAAALPAYRPPDAFWAGLAERRERHGFLIVFDEVVTGLGRTGSWLAAEQLPLQPDIVTVAKGLGAGYAAIGAVLCHDRVYQAIASGSRAFEHGHTWDGAPLSCAVGRAVIQYLRDHDLVSHVRRRGPRLRQELDRALAGCEMVREVRGHGFLLGVDYVDPTDGESPLDPRLCVARRIDEEALRRGLIVYSTQPTADGYTADQTLLAPAFVSSEQELDLIVDRLAQTVLTVEAQVKSEIAAPNAHNGRHATPSATSVSSERTA